MSNPSAPRKRNKYLSALPFRRSRSKSPAQPGPPTSNVLASNALASGPTVTVRPATPTTPPQSNQGTAPRPILQEDVLIRLEPEHQKTIRDHCTVSDPLDISASIRKAIDAAEEKKQLCIKKQWSMTIGGKTIVLRDKVNTVVDLISKFKDIGSIAVGADPVHAGLPWAGICLLLQVVVADKEQMDALMNGLLVALSSQKTADLYLGCYNDQPAGAHAENLRETLLRLYFTIMAFLAEALRLWDANGPSRFGNALLGDDDLRKFPSNCRERLEDVGSALRLCDRQLDERTAELVADTKKHVVDIADQLKDLLAEATRTRVAIDLAKLPVVAGAQHDSSSTTSACLKGTRVELLADITRWADDQTGECVFWLQGIAGEGKSAVAKTIATELQHKDKLGASFFFKSDEVDRTDAKRFFITIATQLAQRIDGMKAYIADFLNNELTGYDKSIERQFEDLIAAPLRKISGQSSHSSFIIVIDALDECRETDAKQVIELLAQCEPFGIRSFVTSRPDAPVKKAFAGLEHTQYRQVILRDHTRDRIHHDITLFLEEQFEHMRKGLSTSQNDWPGPDVVQALAQRSIPLFIFATTVCAFIAKDDFFGPDEQLEAVLAETSEDRLSQTYLPVLKRLLKDRTPKQVPAIIEEFCNLIGPVVLSAEPLPVESVIKLHGLKSREQLRTRLGRLHSVLHVGIDDNEEDQTIHPFHLSFRDFLVEPDEPHDFQIDERRVHASIATTCMSLMMQPGKLRQDICAMRKPGTRRVDVNPRVVNEHIKPDLAYACRHWLSHQVRSGRLLDDAHQVYRFLTCHFLYWFEAMAWLGKVYEILPVLGQLRSLIEDTGSAKLRELVEDVHYFIRDFSYIADQAPLQLYASALIFAPESSQIKALFGDLMPRWLSMVPKVANVRERNSLVLEGHTDSITAMSISSCEEFLATRKEYLATLSRFDEWLYVWDTATGDCTSKLPFPSCAIWPAITFSHDTKYLAAAYFLSGNTPGDIPVCAIIYDVNTGNKIDDYYCTRGVISKPSHVHVRLAFAPGPSNTLFVVTLDEGHLEVWRSKHGSHTIEQAWSMRTASERIGDFILSASDSLVSCFSHNSRRITSWHLESGAYVGTHSMELGTSDFEGFIDCQGRDLIYWLSNAIDLRKIDRERRVRDPEHGVWDERMGVEKLNIRTGHVEQVTSIERAWYPWAISFNSGVIAVTKHGTGPVYIHGLSQCLKTANLTRDVPLVFSATVAQNVEMILLEYRKHLELRDVQGNVVFRSSEVDLGGLADMPRVSVSGDGSVVIAQLRHGTHVWFVKSGRELQLPYMDDWSCLPAVSGDGTLMAFCSNAPKTIDLTHLSLRHKKSTHAEATSRPRIDLWDLETNQRVKIVNGLLDDDDSIDEPWMVFSEDNKTLHTDKGDLDLETSDWKTNSLHKRDEPKIRISRDRSWLQVNYGDMLWLPQSYRPLSKPERRFGKNTIAYDCGDGRVVTMRLVDPCE